MKKDIKWYCEYQKQLKLNMIPYDLSVTWNSHWLITNLRNHIKPIIEEYLKNSDVLFDPQDLEHQVLFFLTTFSPGEITEDIILQTIQEQLILIKDRLSTGFNREEVSYLLRGLRPFYPDLNEKHRLSLKTNGDNIFAVGDGRIFEVEFKKIEDPKLIRMYTSDLHYIHNHRMQGDAFGFFFKGDKYPWAIETTELSTYAREYKRDALLAHGIHPDKAIELTRLYTLPGSPKNAISLIDKLVKRYYLENSDVEAIFTCTMPSYSKTKSTTIAGGINRVLCIKESPHYFVKDKIGGIETWRAVTRRWLEENKTKPEDIRTTHKHFRLLPVVDVYMNIRDTSLKSLDMVNNSGEAIYYGESR